MKEKGIVEILDEAEEKLLERRVIHESSSRIMNKLADAMNSADKHQTPANITLKITVNPRFGDERSFEFSSSATLKKTIKDEDTEIVIDNHPKLGL